MQRSASRTSLAEHVGAAAVDDDEVHVLGAVELAGALGAGQDVDVVRDRLAGRRARQQAHQRRDVLERRDDLLDARRSRRGPCGSVVVSVALPSLVTSTTEPVSATKKLPPEMPMSAVR